jgi:RNA polymerase sporulation-specific sigma factor
LPHHLCPTAADCSDDDLVARFRAGDLEALDLLFDRYRRFAKAKARGYFLVGADFDDIEQEGMIGLFKAIRDFRPDRQASFRAFAELCVTRQIITAIKAATRHKHQPLNQYVSLSAMPASGERESRALHDLLDDHHVPDPADEVVSLETVAAMRAAMAAMLSTLEVAVLRLYLEGRSYQEISELLGRHAKSIDNALQRIKRKLEAYLRSFEAEELAAAVA